MLDFILGKDIAVYVRRHRRLVVCALALTVVSTLFVVIPAYLIKPFVDEGMKAASETVSWKIPWIAFDHGSVFSWHLTHRVLVENISPTRLLVILVMVTFVSVLIKSIALYLSGLAAAAFSNRAVRSLRVDLFRKFVTLPLSFFDSRKSGELVARATADLAVMQGTISNVLLGVIQHPLTVLVFLVYLLVMNFRLTLLMFVLGPVVIGMIRLFGRKVKKHAVRVQDRTAEVTSAYQETLLCLKVIYGFFRGDDEVRRFRALADELYRSVMRWNRWDLGLGPLMDVTGFLVLPVLLIVGKVYFHHTLGELMSMIYAFSHVYSPLRKLARVNNRLKTLQGATRRVFDIMATIPDIRDPATPRVLPRHKESIAFEGVSFGYSPDKPVLKDISFRVAAGEMAAFVGSTGAGKSTLMDLIPRFYDVTSGRIRIDGIDIRDVTLSSLRRQIGIVGQDVVLFHDTIANNIRYGAPDKDMDEIVAAAKAAHAHEFIMAQPKGYQTLVGDQGILLSGGQKQRLSIARAILINPSILMLDEAASALDAESERLVQAAIERLQGGPTILVVAHRLSAVMTADRIFVLEDGRIVESGTRDELLGRAGRFRQLYDMQYRHGT